MEDEQSLDDLLADPEMDEIISELSNLLKEENKENVY